MSRQPKTLQDAILYFSDFQNCKDFLVSLRWPDGVVKCPRCGAEQVTWLEKARVWKCYAKHQSPTFTLKTGTIFEDSPIGLEKWLPAVWLIVNCKNGISSYEMARDFGISQKSAWHMDHRIRFALHSGSFAKFSGEVEADETFIGGKARNMHVSKRRRRITGTGGKDKTAVLGILEGDPLNEAGEKLSKQTGARALDLSEPGREIARALAFLGQPGDLGDALRAWNPALIPAQAASAPAR